MSKLVIRNPLVFLKNDDLVTPDSIDEDESDGDEVLDFIMSNVSSINLTYS